MNTDIIKEARFIYRLTFGSRVSDPATQLTELRLEQGVRKSFKDDTSGKSYYLTFRGIKVNRRIFQPTEIEAELIFMQQSTNKSGQEAIVPPSFKEVSALLMQRHVKVEIIHANRVEKDDHEETTDYGETYTVADKCYVYELNPQLMHENNGTVMYVKLNIFSMDKLMTLNKYSKAYVARKLGAGILTYESKSFGLQADGIKPIVSTNVKDLRFLTYTVGKDSFEFIHPYLVQYNESFYDFMARTANRYGEFLYFEDGELTLGLPEQKEASKIDHFYTVTVQNSSDAPFEVSFYRRDSAKEEDGTVGDLNHDLVEKPENGWPKDAFPDEGGEYQYNVEAVNDEYIFPLVKDKFTNLNREKKFKTSTITWHDVAMAHALPSVRSFLESEFNEWYIGMIVSVVKAWLVNEAIDVAKISAILSMTGGGNALKNENHITPWDDLKDQSDGTNVTQFGTLDPSGWMTLDTWSKIRKHQEEQQRHTICINMGTSYANVKLGEKITVEGLEGTYTVIQIQQVSEEVWSQDYEKYDKTTSDMYSGRRSQKIYAIPSFKADTHEQFVPPLLPVPVVRRSGTQTAFVTDNDDPKYQGRVRVMYPWQTQAEVTAMKRKSEESWLKVGEATNAYNDAVAKRERLIGEYTAVDKERGEILAFLKKSPSERFRLMEDRHRRVSQMKSDYAALDDEEKALKARKAEKERLIAEMEKIENPTEEQQIELVSEKAKFSLIEREIAAFPDKRKKAQDDIKKAEAELNDYQEAHNHKVEGNGKDKDDYDDEENPVVVRLTARLDSLHTEVEKAKTESEQAKKNLDKAKTVAETVDELLAAFLKTLSSPWIRVVTLMATPGGGTYFKPRIGDEVLVDYDNGNIERPYVIGSLFSKNVLAPHELLQRRQNPECQWENISMAMVSPNGHHITFTDPPGGSGFITHAISPGLGMYGAMMGLNGLGGNFRDLNGGIHIGDRYGVYEIEMLTHKRAITINSPFGTVAINAFSGITINAPNGDVTIKGKNITLEAGNKVTINSGKNLPEPDFGDSPAKKTTWATIGKAIVNGTVGVLNELFVSSAIDLSLIRHVIEVYVRPVDGTMLLKSRKFLRIEAGLGKAVIKREKYKAVPEELKEQALFLALRDRLLHISTKIDGYYHTCGERMEDFLQARKYYFDVAERLMIDKYSVDIIAIALSDVDRNAELPSLSKENYEGKFVEHALCKGRRLRGQEEMCNYILPFALSFHMATMGYVRQCRLDTFANHMLYHAADVNNSFLWLDRVLMETLTSGWADQQLKLWDKTFKDETNRRDYRTSNPKNPFVKDNKKNFKRTFLLVYLYNVAQAPENSIAGGLLKHIYIGYKLNDVTNPDYIQLGVDYWWRRQVEVIDNERQNSLLRGLYESTVQILKDRWNANFEGLKDKQVWDADLNGQILFSDQEDATHSFEGDGVHKETDANQGNMKHLKWILRSME